MTWTEAKAAAQKLANEHAEPYAVFGMAPLFPADVTVQYTVGVVYSQGYFPVWTAFPE